MKSNSLTLYPKKSSFARKNRLFSLANKGAIPLIVFIALFFTGCDSESTSGGLSSWLGLDLVKMIGSSDPIGKVCLVILFLFSVAAWAIIIYKFLLNRIK